MSDECTPLYDGERLVDAIADGWTFEEIMEWERQELLRQAMEAKARDFFERARNGTLGWPVG